MKTSITNQIDNNRIDVTGELTTNQIEIMSKCYKHSSCIDDDYVFFNDTQIALKSLSDNEIEAIKHAITNFPTNDGYRLYFNGKLSNYQF